MDKIDEAVRTAQRIYNGISLKAPKEREVALLFWKRLIGNSKAVVALATAGFGSQAAAVHRLSIEHFAYMYALVKGQINDEQLIIQAKFDTFSYAQALTKTAEKDDRAGREVLTPEKKESLRAFMTDPVNQNVQSPGINVYNLLDGQDLKFYHDSYRYLSLYAAHANIVSAKWEPTSDEVEQLMLDVEELLKIASALWQEELDIEPLIA